MNEVKKYPIRPYARLLTMLGDQLISDERVALVELVKNSYDADASWVKISFNNFVATYKEDGELAELKKTESSTIAIEEDGCGMTRDVIVKHWLNPATPEKKNRKGQNPTTPKGRILQGEKGIGRFAILKLGKKIRITTRSDKEDNSIESVIDYDFSKYDEDFSDGNGNNLMLDELNVQVSERTPMHFLERMIPWGVETLWVKPNGTLIEISDLNGEWNAEQVKKISYDLTCMQSIFDKDGNGQLFIDPAQKQNEFNVKIFINDEELKGKSPYDILTSLLENNAVLKITGGIFDSKKLKYEFSLNGNKQFVSLEDSRISGYKIFKDYFGRHSEVLRQRRLECGSFKFEFYIFDFATQDPRYHLATQEKETIRKHRVYLYRDGIRVYPYGNSNDDWLQIDMHRGTISAGMFPSNDQIVGCVNISQKDNPLLRDKTNREGLIQNGNATSDFIISIQLFLEFIHEEYFKKQYRETLKKQRESLIVSKNQVLEKIDDLQSILGENNQAQKALACVRNLYNQEIAFLHKRVETTEELAGVGLSVETASHDIMAFMNNVVKNIDGLIRDISISENIDRDSLLKELNAIRGGVSFIDAQLKDIQLLFKSSKQRRRNLFVKDILDKVTYIYRRILKSEKIELNVVSFGSPLVAKTTDAVLLQLLINLFDNSVYWLQSMNIPKKQIEVLLDGDNGFMIFSDNGPGIRKDDAPYIFEPFYSGKGEEGRGLGLYIARQLLERHAYSIELADISAEKRLSGANFVVNFIAKSEEI